MDIRILVMVLFKTCPMLTFMSLLELPLLERLGIFRYGYMSLWQKISEALTAKVHLNTEVLAIRRNSYGVSMDVINSSGEVNEMEFDKIIILAKGFILC